VQCIYDAGEAIENNLSNKLAKNKLKIMYATLENVFNDFETQLIIIVCQQYKSTPVVDVVDLDKLRALFEEKYIDCKIFADEHIPEVDADASLNKTFF